MSNSADSAESRRKKVLVFQESWGRGGIETFVMGMVRGLDPRAYEIELFSAYDWDGGYDAELAERGVTRTAVFPGRMPGLLTRFLRGTRAWRRRLAAGDVDVVHVNAMNGMTLAYAAMARRCGVPIRVVHAHGNDFGDGARAVKLLAHRLGKSLWGGAATARLACSREAGAYLFSEGGFDVVPNGIDVHRFAFDGASRGRVRRLLGVADDALLVGSIGRVSYHKNPLFSVRLFAELRGAFPDAHLLFVGNGELEGEVRALAEELGVAQGYLHVDSVPDPEVFYAALDVFLLPSRSEGLPYALVEAQCEGLPCIVSEAVGDEACVTDLVSRLPLEAGIEVWAKAACAAGRAQRDRVAYASAVEAAGFSVDASVAAVEAAYDA